MTFHLFLIFSVFFSFSSFSNTKGKTLFSEMEKDYKHMKIRSWLPTSMANRGSKGSAFYQWIKEDKNSHEIPTHLKQLKTSLSASCFEIVILFSMKAGLAPYREVKHLFLSNDRHRFPPKWIKGWLYSLSGGKNKKLRTHYVRAKRPLYKNLAKNSPLKEMNWGIPHQSYEKGIRIFPKAGDIIFFNPIGKRKNSHFDHVALATGKKITRTKACLEFARMKKKCLHNNVVCDELQKNIRFCEEYKKIRPNNEPLEAEILSFYGRGSRKDAPIERTTIEHMLDTHSLIKRNPLEGGDRQVFFATAPWIK